MEIEISQKYDMIEGRWDTFKTNGKAVEVGSGDTLIFNFICFLLKSSVDRSRNNETALIFVSL